MSTSPMGQHLEGADELRTNERCAFCLSVKVALPGWAHRTVLEAIASVLRDGQTVLISSHAALGALHRHRLLAGRGCGAMLAAWGATVVAGWRTGPLAELCLNLGDAVIRRRSVLAC